MEQNKHSYKPNRISPPGDTLLELLEGKEMLQTDLARRIGRPVKTINEIIKGKAAITSETAIQLERALGVPAEFWNQREANYRAYLASQKELDRLSAQKDWLKKFPIKEMLKRAWFQCSNDITDQMICLLNFFGVATPEQWADGWTKRKLAFRKATNVNNNIGAISVWLRQGEIEGHNTRCQPFNKELLLSSIDIIRQLTLEQDSHIFIPQLQEICSACGIAVVFVQPFQNVPIYGASYWLSPDKALIQLSLRGKTADILWFTIFHELGHIIKHSKKEFFIEIDDKSEFKSADEIEADQYASEVLVPSAYLNSWLNSKNKLNKETIVAFSKKLGIAPGILVGRLQYIKRIPYSACNDLKIRYNW